MEEVRGGVKANTLKKQLLISLVSCDKPAGTYAGLFTDRRLASGIYFVRLTAGNYSADAMFRKD